MALEKPEILGIFFSYFVATLTNLTSELNWTYLITRNVCSGLQMWAGVRYASFDGDADRIVYYYLDAGESRCWS